MAIASKFVIQEYVRSLHVMLQNSANRLLYKVRLRTWSAMLWAAGSLAALVSVGAWSVLSPSPAVCKHLQIKCLVRRILAHNPVQKEAVKWLVLWERIPVPRGQWKAVQLWNVNEVHASRIVYLGDNAEWTVHRKMWRQEAVGKCVMTAIVNQWSAMLQNVPKLALMETVTWFAFPQQTFASSVHN